MQRRPFLALAAILPTLVLPTRQGARAEPAAGPALKLVYTRVDTPFGFFVIAVDPARAPVTVANYLAYVDRGLLDGGSVYRIVTPANQSAETKHKIAVVQWGMNSPDEAKPPLPAIAHETTQQTGLRHRDGTVSMARNGPGTATAEFFICIGDQPELDFGGRRNPDGQGFAAFGQVVAGQDVVQAIYRQAQPEQYLKPPIAVRSVTRLTAGMAAAEGATPPRPESR